MWKVLLATCALLGVFAPFGDVLHADLVGIEFDDRANPNHSGSGGPLWTGVVDTVSNKLRIDTWREQPGHGTEFWTPAQLPTTPMVWDAIGANGLPFDVPDNFGLNGVVDFGDDSPENLANDFAFISPVSVQAMPWYAFDTENGVVIDTVVVNFTLESIIYPGWGGMAFIHPTNGYTVRVVQPNPPLVLPDPYLDEYDYRNMPFLPKSAPGHPEITDTFSSATAATVTVKFRDTTPLPHIHAIPEPAAYLSVALVGAACWAATWWKKRAARGQPA